jgi:hypothetical protein
MIFGFKTIFGSLKTNTPPLTTFCTALELEANFLRAANRVMTDDSSQLDKRASILSLLLMAAAGHLRLKVASVGQGSHLGRVARLSARHQPRCDYGRDHCMAGVPDGGILEGRKKKRPGDV